MEELGSAFVTNFRYFLQRTKGNSFVELWSRWQKTEAISSSPFCLVSTVGSINTPPHSVLMGSGGVCWDIGPDSTVGTLDLACCSSGSQCCYL